MASIFISYRKTGVDKGSSLNLSQDLRESFGDDAVFRDDESLGLGRFDEQIIQRIKSSRAMIVVIGPSWIDRILDLYQSEDWVCREIEEGLKWQLLMVPLFIDDAQLPKGFYPPGSIKGLFDFQSWRISNRHWKEDVSELIDLLSKYLGLPKKVKGQAPIPNLSGDWIDTDGVPVTLEHRGESIRLSLLDYYGKAIGHGEGIIKGNKIQFSIFRPDLGNGRGTGIASPDGRQISGSVQYGSQLYGFSILRR